MKKLIIAGAILLSTIGLIPESYAYYTRVVCNPYCHRVVVYGYGYRHYGYYRGYHRGYYRGYYGPRYRGYYRRGYYWR
jgi:hypothetical protein